LQDLWVQSDNKDLRVRKAREDPLGLMVGKDSRDLSALRVTPVTTDRSDLLEVPALVAEVERLVNLVELESRVCRVHWVRLECRDQQDHRETLDHLDQPVNLDCRDSQVFQVVMDSRALLVCDLRTPMIPQCM